MNHEFAVFDAAQTGREVSLRRVLVLGAVLAGLGWLAGCGDSTTDPVPTPTPAPPPDPPRATTVTVSPATAELTCAGRDGAARGGGPRPERAGDGREPL